MGIRNWRPSFPDVFRGFPNLVVSNLQQKRVYPYPLVAGSARPNPKMGAPNPENPLLLGFSVLRGGLRPWSETMVSEGARPWGRARSGDCQTWLLAIFTRRRSFALFCALLQTCVCALLRSFVCFCVRPRLERPRLERPRLGAAEF